jgi:hypothetical protein
VIDCFVLFLTATATEAFRVSTVAHILAGKGMKEQRRTQRLVPHPTKNVLRTPYKVKKRVENEGTE